MALRCSRWSIATCTDPWSIADVVCDAVSDGIFLADAKVLLKKHQTYLLLSLSAICWLISVAFSNSSKSVNMAKFYILDKLINTHTHTHTQERVTAHLQTNTQSHTLRVALCFACRTRSKQTLIENLFLRYKRSTDISMEKFISKLPQLILRCAQQQNSIYANVFARMTAVRAVRLQSWITSSYPVSRVHWSTPITSAT